jgi:hypothetical protein
MIQPKKTKKSEFTRYLMTTIAWCSIALWSASVTFFSPPNPGNADTFAGTFLSFFKPPSSGPFLFHAVYAVFTIFLIAYLVAGTITVPMSQSQNNSKTDKPGTPENPVRVEPPVGSYAATARMLVEIGVMTGDEADRWKDEQKEANIE